MKLVFHSSIITMMHGPINIRFYLYLTVMPYPGMGGIYWQTRSPDLLEACQFCGPPSRVGARDSQIIVYLKLWIRVEFVGVLVCMLGRELGNAISKFDECSIRGRGRFEDVFLEK